MLWKTTSRLTNHVWLKANFKAINKKDVTSALEKSLCILTINLLLQIWENWRNLNFRPQILVVRHYSQLSSYAISRKTNKPNSRKWRKTEFWNVRPKVTAPPLPPAPPQICGQHFLSWDLPLLDSRNCWKLSLYVISRKTNDPNSRKWQKTSFGAWFRHVGTKFGPRISFFFKNLALLVTRFDIMYNRKN